MPSTLKLSDIWESTLTEMLGHDSKRETGKVLRCWVKHHKLEQFYQLVSWDNEEFTSLGGLSSYIKKPNQDYPTNTISF